MKLTSLQKWILWHLHNEGRYYDTSTGTSYYVTSKVLVSIIPKLLLRDIEKVDYIEKRLNNLCRKGLLTSFTLNGPRFLVPGISDPSISAYSVTSQGTLVYRKYVEDEIVTLFTTETRGFIESLEKQGIDSGIIKEIKKIIEKVKNQALDDVARTILSCLKGAPKYVLPFILEYLQKRIV